MNRHARGGGLSGTFTSRSGASRGTAGQVDTSHSVHFNVHADAKVRRLPGRSPLFLMRAEDEVLTETRADHGGDEHRTRHGALA